MKGNDIESGVLVPVLQACVTGLLAGCAVLAGGVMWRWQYTFPGSSLVACVVVFASWLFFRVEVGRRLDVASGVTLNQTPGETPAGQPEPIRGFQLEVDYNEGRAGDYLSFGVEPERFTAWCQGVASGRGLAEDSWTGSAGLFSKSEYRQLREQLVERGFLRLRGKHHSQGFQLTGKGKALTSGVARARAHASNTPENDTTW